MRMDAIGAAVRYRNGDVDQFPSQGIERSGGAHDRFQAVPGAFENLGLVGQATPEIVDEIRLPGRPDIVENRFDLWVRFRLRIGPELDCGHSLPPCERAPGGRPAQIMERRVAWRRRFQPPGGRVGPAAQMVLIPGLCTRGPFRYTDMSAHQTADLASPVVPGPRGGGDE